MKFLLFLLLALPAFAQSDLPERGAIADLKGKTKVYVIANAEHFKVVKKELGKRFTVAARPADAEFFLEYKVITTDRNERLAVTSETIQLDAFIYRDKTKVVAWSDSAYDVLSPASLVLTKRFIKALKK